MRILFLAAFLVAGNLHAQLIDRVVATVNNEVITQSEWEEQERFEALLDKRDPQAIRFNGASLERVIDHKILKEQLVSLKISAPTAEELNAQEHEIRQQLGIDSDRDWKLRLDKYSLEEDEFSDRLAEQLTLVRFVDMRFRPRVQVSELQVEQYYGDHFVPEMRKRGTSEKDIPKMADVREQITRILVEEHMDEVFNAWLKTLRGQSQIRRFLTGS